MAEEMVINQGTGGGNIESMKASLDARVEALVEQARVAPELAAPMNFWDIVAVGPFQVPNLMPGRLIDVGEPAAILTVVYLNPNVPHPAPGQNACDIIAGFHGKIELTYVTGNTQTMTNENTLTQTHCIHTTPGVCWYTHLWVFTPTKPACLYVTDICARICNCDNYYVRQYSGFARWVANLDYDLIFGAPTWQFDHPIRYMVSDPKEKCDCPES